MGANSTQALAIAVFFLAFVVLALGMAAGGNLLLLLLAIALLGVSVGLFRRAKPWEHQED